MTAQATWIEGQGLLENLYIRWQAERVYEDIADYAAIVEKHVEKHGGKFVAMHKRPFGYTFFHCEKTYRVAISGKKYTVTVA